MPEAIDPRDLIPMDVFAGEPFTIDLVYAQGRHPENIFGRAVYTTSARLTLHKSLAGIILAVSRLLSDRHGWTLVLKDGLRPVEAQAIMIETDIVKRNPHWLRDPGRLLSGPGQGAHPRGMAIDVSVEGVDMGTVFDAMVPESARDYDGFDESILQNRKQLEAAFMDAAAALGLPLLPLPSEWWDFRLPMSYFGDIAALSDADLPPPLKMCETPSADEVWEAHFHSLAKSILLSL